MAASNVEILRSMYARLNETGDLDEALKSFDPDVEFEISWRSGRDSPDFQVLHGIDQVKRALEENLEPFERFRFQVHEFREAGEDVVAILELAVTPKGSSAEISTGRFGYVCTFRGGKVIRVQDFPDPDEALEAAGLSPSPE
jgi:ketosteroid isomerase-like protein